jgi:hypothetical protein
VDDPHVFSLKDQWQGPREIDDGFSVHPTSSYVAS